MRVTYIWWPRLPAVNPRDLGPSELEFAVSKSTWGGGVVVARPGR